MKEAYHIEEGEKLTCMIALGYGESQGVSHKIKTMEQVSNATSNSPSWFRKGVEAALLAPTAINQQKFSFFLQDQEGTKALEEEANKLKSSIERREKLLSNENYVNKAPANIVEMDRKKLAEEKEKLSYLLEKLN